MVVASLGGRATSVAVTTGSGGSVVAGGVLPVPGHYKGDCLFDGAEAWVLPQLDEPR